MSDEKGYVKQLHYNPDDYGTEYLRDRENLVLLKVNSKISLNPCAVIGGGGVSDPPVFQLLIFWVKIVIIGFLVFFCGSLIRS